MGEHQKVCVLSELKHVVFRKVWVSSLSSLTQYLESEYLLFDSDNLKTISKSQVRNSEIEICQW